jgi:hypothetical protein
VQLLASLGGLALLRTADAPAPGPLRAEAPAEVLGAPAPAPDPRLQRQRAVEQLLQARSAALLARDREAFLATVSPQQPAFVERQGRLFDALAEVPLASWSYEVDAVRQRPPDPALDARYGAEWWAPDVQLRYAIDGFDPEPTYASQRPTFVRAGEGWLLAADDDFEAAGEASTRGLWDFGPVIAHRSTHALVLGHPGLARPAAADRVGRRRRRPPRRRRLAAGVVARRRRPGAGRRHRAGPDPGRQHRPDQDRGGRHRRARRPQRAGRRGLPPRRATGSSSTRPTSPSSAGSAGRSCSPTRWCT